MSVAYISYLVGVTIGTFLWGGLLSAGLIAVARRSDRRTLITIALGIVVLLALPLGFEVMVETLVSAVPVWFILVWLFTRKSPQKPQTHTP